MREAVYLEIILFDPINHTIIRIYEAIRSQAVGIVGICEILQACTTYVGKALAGSAYKNGGTSWVNAWGTTCKVKAIAKYLGIAVAGAISAGIAGG